MNTDVLPIVSVACITYNHEPYIRQCLDGFVMQKTNFPFEIVIHDDASTDNTKVIIQEYCQKYPHLFRPIFQDINRFKEGKGILARFVFPECRGKYIALCEGDDYWTDPLKLQKQVDFLEDNKEYSMCFTNAIQHYEDKLIDDSLFFDAKIEKDYIGVELFRNWNVPTASVVCRCEVVQTNLYENVNSNPCFVFGDILLILTCAKLGKIRGFTDPTCVYRRTDTGALARQAASYNGQLAYIRHVKEIPNVFGKEYLQDSEDIVVLQYYAMLKQALSENKVLLVTKFLMSSLWFSFPKTLLLYCKKLRSFILHKNHNV